MGGVKTASEAEAGQPAAKQRLITYAEAGVEAIREEMRRDSSIFYMGQGIGPRGGNFQQSRGLWEEFGEQRVRDTPIAERGQTGLGIGAALAGSHPVVDIVFLDFVLEAICEIIQQASTIHYISDGKFKVPVVVRAAGGGIRSTGPHHSHTFYSFFMHIPGLKVALPSTPFDLKGLMKSTLRDPNPVIFIEHKSLYNIKGVVPEEEYLIPFRTGGRTPSWRTRYAGRDEPHGAPRDAGCGSSGTGRRFGRSDRSPHSGSVRQGHHSALGC